MHELRVIEISDSTVVAVNKNGEEFRVSLDEAQIAKLRSPRNDSSAVKVAPREIQALIRAGLSADEVCRVSGASPEDVERYEAPVIAERDFILNSALATPTSLDVHDEPVPFGIHVRSRLDSLHAEEQRWVSWKDPADGWIVKVEFTAKGIDHDARWAFDPRRGSLIPVNADASTLSQRGEIDSGLVPRLRAVDVMTGAIPTINDSGAHTRRIPTSPVFSQVSESIKTGAINIIPSASGVPVMSNDKGPSLSVASEHDSAPATVDSWESEALSDETTTLTSDEPRLPTDFSDSVMAAAPFERPDVTARPTPAPVSARDEMAPSSLAGSAIPGSEEGGSTPTADLLEALRKRRQQRDEAPSWLTDGRVESTHIPEESVPNPISDDVLNAVAIEVTETFSSSESSTFDDTSALDGEPLTDTGRQRRARKSRPTLPAWDNIVFGRPADDSLG